MKCPICKYQHGWDGETATSTKGDKGDFYSVSNGIEMVRDVGRSWESDTNSIHGCPSCGAIFMGV